MGTGIKSFFTGLNKIYSSALTFPWYVVCQSMLEDAVDHPQEELAYHYSY
jgi:hypothetical protein